MERRHFPPRVLPWLESVARVRGERLQPLLLPNTNTRCTVSPAPAAARPERAMSGLGMARLFSFAEEGVSLLLLLCHVLVHLRARARRATRCVRNSTEDDCH